MRFLRSRAGQIVIPAMFIFPTLMLFVYLIYETAKLSREKIRHQFAIDAAAFVEMTNYSDFLNRTAYVNGPFPMRIFDEGFKNTPIDCEQKAGCHGPTNWFNILKQNGGFPTSLSNKTSYDQEQLWDIGFDGVGSPKNSIPPQVSSEFVLTSMADANSWWINWDDANQVYKLYVQIYQLLGSVEDAQYSVLKRLSSGHNFLKKSYWLNTGDPIADADIGSASFDISASSFKAVPYCHQTMVFHGNKPTGSAFQPWQVYAPEPHKDKNGNTINGVSLPNTIDGCTGLFQLMWVDPNVLKKMRDPYSGSAYGSRGYPVTQRWTAPNNYFNYNFNNQFDGGRPMVHVTVAIGVGSKAPGGPGPSVWPNPTPKFQVRTYP
ncbi:MAG: hypothetical protein AAB320_05230 [Elusimicrobiota bacterium]